MGRRTPRKSVERHHKQRHVIGSRQEIRRRAFAPCAQHPRRALPLCAGGRTEPRQTAKAMEHRSPSALGVVPRAQGISARAASARSREDGEAVSRLPAAAPVARLSGMRDPMHPGDISGGMNAQRAALEMRLHPTGHSSQAGGSDTRSAFRVWCESKEVLGEHPNLPASARRTKALGRRWPSRGAKRAPFPRCRCGSLRFGSRAGMRA